MLEETTIQKLNELIRKKTDETNNVEDINALAELVTAVNVSPPPDNSPVIGLLVPANEDGEDE